MRTRYYLEKLTPADKDELVQECEDIENYFNQFGLSKLLNKLPLKKLEIEYPLFYQALRKLYQNIGIDITFEEFWEDLDIGDIEDGNLYFKWIIAVIKDYSRLLDKPIEDRTKAHDDILNLPKYSN